MDKVLVIGSNSFSGASFCAFLLKKGVHVFGVSRSPESHEVFLPYRWIPEAVNFSFNQIDLNYDLDKLEKLIRSERIKYVANFAAQSMVGESWKYPEHWMMTNVVSLVKLQERLRRLDFLERYVHITTPEVYGSTDGWIKEDTIFNPSTPYAVSRAAGDMSLKTYFDAYQFPVVFTRAANVYGPGQQLYRIIPRTILSCMLGKKLPLHGGGFSTRSFIHMDDVSDATWRLLLGGENGESYHISTERTVAIGDLVKMICTALSLDFNQCVEIVGDRLGKDSAYWLDSSKIRSAFGWTDKVTLEDGINQSIDWVRSNLNILKYQPLDYQHKP